MRTRHSVFTILILLLSSSAARADVISDWVEAAKAIAEELQAMPGGRMTITTLDSQVALAMFEAVNAIDRRYDSYLGIPASTAPASQQVAASVAAHVVLKAVVPARAAVFDAALAFNLGQVPDGPAKTAGEAIGRAAAEAVLQRELFDAAQPVPNYRPRTAPGVYVPTTMPGLPLSAYVARPWFLKTPTEVQPGPIPPLTSEQYARDVEEVRKIGGRRSSERTSAQTAAATFWAGNRTDLAARLLTNRPGRSLVANARFYALRELALDDQATAVSIAKYDAAFWRPITAIRNADQDGNANTGLDPAWEPLLATPPFAEYPCGHCIAAATIAALFEAEFGGDARLTFLDPTLPGASQTLTPKEYVREVSMSRIYAGVHFRFSNDAAEEMGWRIGRLALERCLKPLPRE